MIPCLHPWPQMADYRDMRCLYCGRELALLKRLTGNGEFCSDQHKQSYHDEYNRLALSRLLQAQTKTDEGRAKKAEAAEAPPEVRPEVRPVVRPVVRPEMEAPSPVKRERGPALPVPIAHKPEPVATGAAGFLPEPMAMLEGPSPTLIAPSSPLSWIPGPVFPVFDQLQPMAIETPEDVAPEEVAPEEIEPDPPLAELLALPLQPVTGADLAPVHMSEAGPFESAAHGFPKHESTVQYASFDLPMAGPVTVPGIEAIRPGVPELCLEDSQPFFPEVFQLLIPPPAEESVEFEKAAELHVPGQELSLGPPETLEGELADDALSAASPEPSEPESEPDVDSLKKLDSGLRTKNGPEPRRGSGRRTELPVAAGPVVDGIALDGLFPPPRRSSGPRVNASAEAQLEEGGEGGVATLQLTEVDEEVDHGARPVVLAEATAPFIEQMLPLTLRIVSPSKPKLVSESHPLLVPSDPQLTTTEILPLRPRMGVGKPPAPEPASKPSGAVKVKPVKDAMEPVIPSGHKDNPDKPFDPREAVLAVKRSINVPENRSSSRKAEKRAAAEAKAPADAQPLVAAGAAEQEKVANEKVIDPAVAASPTGTAPTPQADEGLPAVSATAEKGASSDTAAAKSSVLATSAAETPAPGPGASEKASAGASHPEHPGAGLSNFELHLGMSEKQSALSMLLSKLPMGAKIGIAAGLLLAIAGGGYMIFSGSSKAKASAIAGALTPGPGEDGWITDWAGDTTGNHKGRKISVYHPSLRLTNYEVEFQGKIESNSIGWVFRASDAANYYAVKLATAGSGYRLSKYTVVDGKEKEVGQVPVRPVDGNTFLIRVEVRGDRFTTFIGSNPVDTWVDGELKSGGFGFLTDRGDRAEITKVGVSLLPGSAN